MEVSERMGVSRGMIWRLLQEALRIATHTLTKRRSIQFSVDRV